MALKERIQESYTAQKLAQMRDELRVKIHLARADARDQWSKLEKKWSELEGRLKAVEEASAESRGEVRAAAQALIREIGEGYERIRKLL